jgi:hypothetical protein
MAREAGRVGSGKGERSMSGFPVRWRLFAFVLGVALVLPCLAPAAVQAAVSPGGAALAAALEAGDSWVGRVWGWLLPGWNKPEGQGKRIESAAPAWRPPVRRQEGCMIDPNGHCVNRPPNHRPGRHGLD